MQNLSNLHYYMPQHAEYFNLTLPNNAICRIYWRYIIACNNMRNLSNIHYYKQPHEESIKLTLSHATTFWIDKTYIITFNNMQNLSNLHFHATTCGLGIYQIFIILCNNKILHQLYLNNSAVWEAWPARWYYIMYI